MKSAGVPVEKFPADYVRSALETCKGKINTFDELPAYCGFYFVDEFSCNPEGVAKHFTAENKPRLQAVRDAFAALENFDANEIEAAFKATAQNLGVKVGALSIRRVSPSLAAMPDRVCIICSKFSGKKRCSRESTARQVCFETRCHPERKRGTSRTTNDYASWFAWRESNVRSFASLRMTASVASHLLRFFRPGVFQRDRAIPDLFVRRANPDRARNIRAARIDNAR